MSTYRKNEQTRDDRAERAIDGAVADTPGAASEILFQDTDNYTLNSIGELGEYQLPPVNATDAYRPPSNVPMNATSDLELAVKWGIDPGEAHLYEAGGRVLRARAQPAQPRPSAIPRLKKSAYGKTDNRADTAGTGTAAEGNTRGTKTPASHASASEIKRPKKYNAAIEKSTEVLDGGRVDLKGLRGKLGERLSEEMDES